MNEHYYRWVMSMAASQEVRRTHHLLTGMQSILDGTSRLLDGIAAMHRDEMTLFRQLYGRPRKKTQ